MSGIEFEWEARKAASNRKKHRVSFEEAVTAFEDESALVIDDPAHSKFEDRFILLGMSNWLASWLLCTVFENWTRRSELSRRGKPLAMNTLNISRRTKGKLLCETNITFPNQNQIRTHAG